MSYIRVHFAKTQVQLRLEQNSSEIPYLSAKCLPLPFSRGWRGRGKSRRLRGMERFVEGGVAKCMKQIRVLMELGESWDRSWCVQLNPDRRSSKDIRPCYNSKQGLVLVDIDHSHTLHLGYNHNGPYSFVRCFHHRHYVVL